MFRYVCGLPPREYQDWIEDSSTVTDVKMFDNPLVDKILCDYRTCLPLSLFALWMLIEGPMYGAVLFVEQLLFAAVAALTLTLAEVAGERIKLPVPPCIHFILFGAAHKFKYTAWRINIALGVLLSLASLAFGYPLAALCIIALQYAKSRR